jgi:hypothetical protein
MNSFSAEPTMDGFDLQPLALEPGSGSASDLRSGDLCPNCREATMDYDGLLNLVCPQCGYRHAGCFT